MGHGALALRDALIRSGDALAKTTARAEKYKKESAVVSQNFSKFQQESRAREEDLGNRAREAEKRASSAEAKLRAAGSREEDLVRRLRHAEDQAEAAKREARANAERAASAEKAAVDVAHEKAGAVAYANEANARAEEAEARAGEAEARAREAEAKAREAELQVRQAVAEFRSSPEFENEVVEASLHAYVEGFNACKTKMAATFEITDADLEKVQAEDLGEAPAEDEEAGGEGQDAAEGQGAAEGQDAAEPEKP